MFTTKQQLLNFITNSPGVIVCQHVGFDTANISADYKSTIDNLKEKTGKKPALVGLTYGFNVTIEQAQASSLFLIERGYNAIMIDCMPNNPWTGRDCWDTSLCDMPNLVTNANWLTWLDGLAAYLLHLKSIGGYALLDLFDECTWDRCSWWDWGSCGKKPQPFVAAWRHAHQYLSARGVDNVLWCYCAGDSNCRWTPTDVMWPGDDVVDVAALTIYTDNCRLHYGVEGYRRIVARGKPVGLFGVGPGTKYDGSMDNLAYINSVSSNYPSIKFFQVWHSWPGHKMAIVDNINSIGLMTDKRILSFQDMVMVIDELSELASNARAKAASSAAAADVATSMAASLREFENEFTNLAVRVEAIIGELIAIDNAIDAAGRVIK